MIKNYEEIIIENMRNIVELALDNVSKEKDSIVYFDVGAGEFFVAQENTLESNNIVEVYRLEKGFVDYNYAGCMYCDGFYTCDNMWEDGGEEMLRECTINKLMEKYNMQFVDITEKRFVVDKQIEGVPVASDVEINIKDNYRKNITKSPMTIKECCDLLNEQHEKLEKLKEEIYYELEKAINDLDNIQKYSSDEEQLKLLHILYNHLNYLMEELKMYM